MGCATFGQMVLGCIREQTGQTLASKSVAAFTSSLCFSTGLNSALILLSDRDVEEQTKETLP